MGGGVITIIMLCNGVAIKEGRAFQEHVTRQKGTSLSIGKLWQNIRKHFLTVRPSIVQWSPQGSDRSLGT